MEAPTAGNQIDELELDELNKISANNFDLAKDYYSKDNPFTKVMVGAGIGTVGSFSSAIIALGFSQFFVAGGILYYDTAFLISGWATLFSMASLVVAIPAVIGSIGYGIYKFTKTKKLKEFMSKLADKNDNTMNEERKIFQRIFEETKTYFLLNLKSVFQSNAKDIIVENTLDIIKKIENNRNSLEEQNLQKDVDELRMQISNMIVENILIIGSTGVGKSTLINEFLELKNNKAPEGNSAIPQEIENWPKKYPVNPNDTSLQGINIYDTEGIEKTSEKNNDINAHLNRIATFISNPDTKLNEKMNIIWYCISGNKLDGDEAYINSILNLYQSKIKIPIIFVYTKAYSSKEDEIEIIREGLQNFKYFKENPEEFNFVEVIARDVISKKSNKVIEEKRGLDDLMEKSLFLSKQSILSPIFQQISGFYNKRGKLLIKKLSEKLQEQYNEIIIKHDKFKTFKDKLVDIFVCIYEKEINNNQRIINFINGRVEEIFEIMEKIKGNELKKIIKDFEKHYLMNRIELDLRKFYDEKETNKKDYKEFKEDIQDYLIEQINASKDIYGLFFLFDMFRDAILEQALEDLKNQLNDIKIKATKKLENEINIKINEFKCLFETKK